MTPPSRHTGALAAGLAALVAPVLIATPAAASSTSNEVVYTVDDDNDGIYSIVLRDLASRGVTTVLPADTTNEYLYDEPELSPDGERIAFSTDRGGSTEFEEGIAVVNRDGSGFRRVTTPPSTADSFSVDVGAAWSPDGSRLLFTRITVTTPAGTTEETVDTALLTVPAAGGTPTGLVGGENGYTGDWSPDGSKIVLADVLNATTDDSGPLRVVNSDGSGGAVTLGSGVTGYSPAWSPDGSTIAYATVTTRDTDTTRGQDVAHIATVPATGGSAKILAPTRPTSAPTVAEYPAWSPDGESILYDLYGYSDVDDFPPGDLWAVDKEGRRAGRVTTTPGDEAQPHVHGPVPAAVSAGTESTYVPVTPKRVLDTREGTGGAPQRKLGPQETVTLAVRGLQTEPTAVPADATAVVLNVTVTGTTAATDVRAYPSGGTTSTSSLNAGAGDTVPNLVTVALGSDGGVTLRNTAGQTHLFADIAGYYVPAGAGNGFSALDPARILDTRSGVGAPQAKVAAAEFVEVQVKGTLPTAEQGRTVTVPADARAVVLNVTATSATAGTDVRVYPPAADGAFPRVSNLNLRAGQTVANLVTVAVGEGGTVRLRNSGGSVNLIADIAGYYSPSATGRFVPVTPSRFLDTRNGVGAAPIPVTAEGFVDLKVAGARGVPAGATAAVLNLTGTGVSASTDLRGYPSGAAGIPTVSNLNLIRGATRANAAIVKTGPDGRIRIRNAGGQLNLIGDLAGYMIG
jgi:Tol biopolymer transport system component